MYNAEKTASRSEGLRARNVIQKNKPQSKYTRETEEEIINFKPWAHTQEKVANGNERKKNTKKKKRKCPTVAVLHYSWYSLLCWKIQSCGPSYTGWGHGQVCKLEVTIYMLTGHILLRRKFCLTEVLLGVAAC